ncbi:Trypsin Blo t 3 [Cladobotryum mycophilum]|uniref:Trypsin Blo t 3 n=1 Tax=Cladobotryum mycophilum TaxID=491253 RepID=A0ABR0SBI0_9HYPO
MQLVNSFAQLALAAVVAVPPVAAIVGGSNAAPGQFPFVVSVQKAAHICGGTLINSRQILTGASCVNGSSTTDIKVRAGSIEQGSGGMMVQVQKIRVHPGYEQRTAANNVAILDLATPLSNIKPASLPLASATPRLGSAVTVVGWGTIRPGTSMIAADLRYTTVSVIDSGICQQHYSGHPESGSDEFCVGVENNGKSSCSRDTGGPVLQGETVVGVISLWNGCGMAADVDMAVGPYLAWINENAIH